MFDPTSINQDSNHTPHPEVDPHPFTANVERTAFKLVRDLGVSVGPVILSYFTTGHFSLELFLPALALGLYRTARDIFPTLFSSTPVA